MMRPRNDFKADTSFGAGTSRMADNLSSIVWNPSVSMEWPKYTTELCWNLHFAMFSLKLASHNFWKTTDKVHRWSFSSTPPTNISSSNKWPWEHLPRSNLEFIEKQAGAECTPNGNLSNANMPSKPCKLWNTTHICYWHLVQGLIYYC
jgi:hypothetical protein